MVSRNVKLELVLASLVLAPACAPPRLLTDAQMKDQALIAQVAEEVTDKNEDEHVKVHKLAIIGFGASKSTAKKTGWDVNHIMGTMNAIENLQGVSQGRACHAVDAAFADAPATLTAYGFEAIDTGDKMTQPAYAMLADKSLGLECAPEKAPADTGIQTLFSGNLDQKLIAMNKLIDELGVDGLVIAKLLAQGSVAGNASLAVFTKGADKAKLAWKVYVKEKKVQFEAPAAATPEAKAENTARVYRNTFALLVSRLAHDMK